MLNRSPASQGCTVCPQVQEVCGLVCNRSAQLSAMALAAVLRHLGRDGSQVCLLRPLLLTADWGLVGDLLARPSCSLVGVVTCERQQYWPGLEDAARGREGWPSAGPTGRCWASVTCSAQPLAAWWLTAVWQGYG